MQNHSFADASSRMSRLRSDDYDLYIRQGPERARVAGTKEKDRKPVDPPPIIQLKIRDDSDPQQNYLQSPYYFMCTNLYPASETPKENSGASSSYNQALAGTLVSSLHRLKDIDNTDGGFFVFGDLSVKVEGQFRLRFSLFEISNNEVHYIKSITSSPFTVYPMKNFPGMSESTFLSRSFGDQGVRLRIRKEPRTLVRKRAFRPPPPEAYPSNQMRRPSSPDSHYIAHGYPTPHSSVDYGYPPYHDMHKRVKMDGAPQYPPPPPPHGREPYGERSPYGEYPPNSATNPPGYHPGYPNYPNSSYQQQRSPTTPGGYFPAPPHSAHSNQGYGHYPPPPPQHQQHEYPSRHSSYSGPSPIHPTQQPSPLYESPNYHPSSQSTRSPITSSAPYKSYDRQATGPPATYPPPYPEDSAKQSAYRTTQPQSGSVHSPPGGLPSPGLSRTSGSMASHTSSPMNSSSRGLTTMPAQPPSPYKSGFSLPPLQLPPLSEPHGSTMRTQTHSKTPGPPISFDSAVSQTYAT
ncbi:hypothetical protein TWF696_007782 [Orbilia brochopaga]|uniref:Velvet domain-containing protein n=1 Tax=Orbilia brochopaga TaxID=3140254 RepID=A0AAV9UMC1_9PEZI